MWAFCSQHLPSSQHFVNSPLELALALVSLRRDQRCEEVAHWSKHSWAQTPQSCFNWSLLLLLNERLKKNLSVVVIVTWNWMPLKCHFNRIDVNRAKSHQLLFSKNQSSPAVEALKKKRARLKLQIVKTSCSVCLFCSLFCWCLIFLHGAATFWTNVNTCWLWCWCWRHLLDKWTCSWCKYKCLLSADEKYCYLSRGTLSRWKTIPCCSFHFSLPPLVPLHFTPAGALKSVAAAEKRVRAQLAHTDASAAVFAGKQQMLGMFRWYNFVLRSRLTKCVASHRHSEVFSPCFSLVVFTFFSLRLRLILTV